MDGDFLACRCIVILTVYHTPRPSAHTVQRAGEVSQHRGGGYTRYPFQYIFKTKWPKEVITMYKRKHNPSAKTRSNEKYKMERHYDKNKARRAANREKWMLKKAAQKLHA